MSTIYKELRNKVRFYRKSKNITTSELTSRICVLIGQLHNIENENYDVFKLELLHKLSKELNISLGELINPNS